MNFNLTVVMKVDDGLSASPWTAYKMNMSIMPKLELQCTLYCNCVRTFCSFIFIVHRDNNYSFIHQSVSNNKFFIT